MITVIVLGHYLQNFQDLTKSGIFLQIILNADLLFVLPFIYPLLLESSGNLLAKEFLYEYVSLAGSADNGK